MGIILLSYGEIEEIWSVLVRAEQSESQIFVQLALGHYFAIGEDIQFYTNQE